MPDFSNPVKPPDSIAYVNERTQFVWFLGGDSEEVKSRFANLKKEKVIKNTTFDFKGKKIFISGFIASVEHPKDLTVRGTEGEFKTSANLFCNGRLRQDNILQEIPSRRIVESYLYGEIHVNDFDAEGDVDRFTRSRADLHGFSSGWQECHMFLSLYTSPWNIKPGDVLLSHGETPHYHRRCTVSLPSSEWDRVVPIL